MGENERHRIVRIEVPAERHARRAEDARRLIGYRSDPTNAESWAHGRDAWQMRAALVEKCALVGTADPLDSQSQNPVGYGIVTIPLAS